MTTMPQPVPTQVTVGVDTHAEVHVAVATDGLGRRLDATSVATTPAGYAELLGWAQHLGQVEAWGIEGTGSFGAGLTRFLRSRGQLVVEVNRPDRASRRRRGKSDPLDAEAAARAVQARQGNIPKAWPPPSTFKESVDDHPADRQGRSPRAGPGPLRGRRDQGHRRPG